MRANAFPKDLLLLLFVCFACAMFIGCSSDAFQTTAEAFQIAPGAFPSELVGNWVIVEGKTKDSPENMELFRDGTGVVDKATVSWKVEDKRFVILSSLMGMACDYKISGSELILTYDDGKSGTFVKKADVEAWKAKKEADRLAAEQKREEEKRKRLEKISTYFTDSRDNQEYRAVTIGNKIWMAENLNYKTDNSICYSNNNSNCDVYGRLYGWENILKVCPSGWRLPSRSDWANLIAAAGGNSAGTRLKADQPDWNGTDDYGFSALPGGCAPVGCGIILGSKGAWWTATEGYDNPDFVKIYQRQGAYFWSMSNKESVDEDSFPKDYGLSVRCVKD